MDVLTRHRRVSKAVVGSAFSPSDFTARHCFGDAVIEPNEGEEVEQVSGAFDLDAALAASKSENIDSEDIIRRKRSTLLRETVEPLPLVVNTGKRRKGSKELLRQREMKCGPQKVPAFNVLYPKRGAIL